MARCYEFGPSLNHDCAQAMVVTQSGGQCACTACGSTCEGRFVACAGILLQPGRIPPSAPAWAIPLDVPVAKRKPRAKKSVKPEESANS